MTVATKYVGKIRGKTQKKENKMNIEIKDVETHNNRVVLVRFSDGTFTKAVCSDNDIFDLDTGITVCVLKRLLTHDPKKKNDGAKKYYKILKSAHKIVEEKEKEKMLKSKSVTEFIKAIMKSEQGKENSAND